MSLDPDVVAAASAAWIWVPDDATAYDDGDVLLVRYPDWMTDPLMVLRTGPLRPGRVAEVLARAGALGADHLAWWVKLDAPDGLAAALQDAGGVLDETVDVLARPLATDDPAPLDPGPAGLELRWQVDLPTSRDGHVVAAAVFGGTVPPDEHLAEGVALERAEIGTGAGGGLVAYLDGTPVGSGGVAMVDGVARLWGGAVVGSARRRGVYAALLAERLAYARRFGATMALVKGRVETSAPILRRAGFTAYGQEQGYRFEL